MVTHSLRPTVMAGLGHDSGISPRPVNRTQPIAQGYRIGNARGGWCYRKEFTTEDD